jgi:hypothetical protein
VSDDGDVAERHGILGRPVFSSAVPHIVDHDWKRKMLRCNIVSASGANILHERAATPIESMPCI